MRSYEECLRLMDKIRKEELSKMEVAASRRFYETFSNEELQMVINHKDEDDDRTQALIDEWKAVREAAEAEKDSTNMSVMKKLYDWMDNLPEDDIMLLAEASFGKEHGPAFGRMYNKARKASAKARDTNAQGPYQPETPADSNEPKITPSLLQQQGVMARFLEVKKANTNADGTINMKPVFDFFDSLPPEDMKLLIQNMFGDGPVSSMLLDTISTLNSVLRGFGDI